MTMIHGKKILVFNRINQSPCRGGRTPNCYDVANCLLWRGRRCQWLSTCHLQRPACGAKTRCPARIQWHRLIFRSLLRHFQATRIAARAGNPRRLRARQKVLEVAIVQPRRCGCGPTLQFRFATAAFCRFVTRPHHWSVEWRGRRAFSASLCSDTFLEIRSYECFFMRAIRSRVT